MNDRIPLCRESCRYGVRTAQYDIRLLDHGCRLHAFRCGYEWLDLAIRTVFEKLRYRVHFWRPNLVLAKEPHRPELLVFNPLRIDERKATDAGRMECERCGCANPAKPDDGHLHCEKGL